LFSADLSGADLSEADLSDADLRSADLGSADLSYTTLSGTYIFETNLRGADLSDANTSEADLSNARGLTKETLDQDHAIRVNEQVAGFREKGSAEVAFRVSMKEGKVNFTARALRGIEEK
jgi:uncharacterized protein YjbI with pentapeptide repeats